MGPDPGAAAPGFESAEGGSPSVIAFQVTEVQKALKGAPTTR
jgi:hypothetical protein